MKKTNLYFNHCFTGTANTIGQLKENKTGQDFNVTVSFKRNNPYIEEVADAFIIEPHMEDEKAYVDYLIQTCMQNEIDLFIPRYQAPIVAKYKERFDLLGIPTMLVGSPEMYAFIDNKVEVYEDLAQTDILKTPDTYVISTYEEFREAYRKLKEKGYKACMKPIIGIGGVGFKRIREDISAFDELFLSSSTTLSKERLENMLKENGTIEPMMLSMYMEGTEYSIDCLAKDGELLAAYPRKKIDGYQQRIEKNEELIEIARKIAKRYNFNYLFNIQVKYHEGVPYLVEINTRAADGMDRTEAVGANMLYWAVQLLQGETPDIPAFTEEADIYRAINSHYVKNPKTTISNN